MNRFYIYFHLKPDGTIFYVGKGAETGEVKNGKWRYRRANTKIARNPLWQNIVAKYGGYTIEIIKTNLTESEAIHLEKYYIKLFRKRSDGGLLANMTDGGEGLSGYKQSEKQRQTMRDFKLTDVQRLKLVSSMTGTKNHRYGKTAAHAKACITIDAAGNETEYQSIQLAAQAIGSDKRNISNVLAGRRKTAAGFQLKWK